MRSPPTIAWTRAQQGIIKRMREQWIPGSFSPAYQEPGYEANFVPNRTRYGHSSKDGLL